MRQRLTELKPVFLPLLLCFLLGGILIINSTYADALFLSSYPKRWLGYYFIVLPISTSLFFTLVNSKVSNASEKGSFFIILGIIAILLLTYSVMILTHLYLIPFILAILIGILNLTIVIIAFNAMSAAFDIRTYKLHAFEFNTLIVIGGIVSSFLIPFITWIGNTTGLFFIALFLMFGSSLCILRLKPIQEKKAIVTHADTMDANLFKQPFFMHLFLLIILSTLITTLISFAFKNALMGIYDSDKLANFLGVFTGFIYITSITLQLTTSKRLLFLMGLSGLMMILPIVSVILGISMMALPVFILFIVIKAIFLLLNTNFLMPCMQLMQNPYPSHLRKKVSLYLKAYPAPVGALAAGLIGYLVTAYLNMRCLGGLIAIISVFWIFITKKALQGYQQTLHDGLKERRYSPDLLDLPKESIVFMEGAIINALNSNDIHLVRAGFSFFENDLFIKYLAPRAIKTAISKRLSHPEPDIRYKAIIALKRFHATDYADALLAQLEQEESEIPGFALIDTLIDFKMLPRVEEAEIYLDKKQAFKVAYGLLALSQANSPAIAAKKRALLDGLLSGDTHDKITLAHIQHYLPPSPEQTHYIETLIQDAIPDVRIEAIKALTGNDALQFVPLLISQLAIKKISYFAEVNLACYKDKILDQLLSVTTDASANLQQEAIIKLLARLSTHLAAIEQLIAFSILPGLERRLLIARQLVRFFKNQPLSVDIQKAIIGMITWLADEISLLRRLDPSNNQNVIVEIEIQLSINRSAFICWYALLTNPQRIKDVANYIEKPTDYPQAEVSKAYELLDSLSTHSKLREAIKVISEPCVQTEKITPLNTRINQSILMLATHLDKKGATMNKMDKIALLRRVKLFKDISVESLVIIADSAMVMDMAQGQVIFKDNDETDRFYCIVSGQVAIKKNGVIFSELKEADYFGELGLLDSMPRTADAIAMTDGILLYIKKEEFLHILDDLPEIMRAVVMQIILYLRQNLARQHAKS